MDKYTVPSETLKQILADAQPGSAQRASQDSKSDGSRGAGVPGPTPWRETIARANSSRVVCYARYLDRTEINCSPPLMPHEESE